jgi:Tfp pilus assembly protein PilO
MLKNFKQVWPPNNPRAVLRLVVGLLLAANVVAAYFVIRPPGGSAQELRRQAVQMNSDLRQKQGILSRTRTLVSKIQSARGAGDQFMAGYFLPRRSAYSMVMAELNDLANQAKVTPRESAYVIEPVDGSDTVEMMQISANYEGPYQALIQFVNLIDKSDRLLVVESLNATPQQGGSKLNVMLKLDTFVTEDGSAK